MNLYKKLRRNIHKYLNEYYLIPHAFKKTANIRIMSSEESVDYIIVNRCSVSRFGDGEFESIEGLGGDYQHPSERLTRMLLECLHSDLPNHKVAIPFCISSYFRGKPTECFWNNFVLKHADNLHKWLRPNYNYLDSLLTRFYFIKTDKSKCGDYIAKIKKIWSCRDIVIVEGKQTRSGIGNDLYDNAESVQRILGPSLSAFSKYDEIYGYIVNNVGKDKLLLLSLGITATVLSYELSKLGYQALDLGHLDIEYEWFRMGANGVVPVNGKFTNESADGHNPGECNDAEYLSQIIADFS